MSSEYYTVGLEMSPPQKLSLSQGIRIPTYCMVPGLTGVHTPTGTVIGRSVFVRLTVVTNRQTDTRTDHRTITIRRILWLHCEAA